MREEVLSALGANWEPVVEEVLLGSCPTPVQFVKHMCHHLVGDVSLDWVGDPSMRHVFLLRDPAEQIPSMQRDLGVIDEAGLGYDRQLELFQSATSPVVIDSRDLLNDPERIMRLLCVELGLDYDPCMVEWSPGRHESYGVWAPYWYTNVETSTGFQPWKPKEAPFPEELQDLLNWAEPMYRQMHAVRLGA